MVHYGAHAIMITKRYVILYKKGKIRRIVDEIQISAETNEECFDEACQVVLDSFNVEEINVEKEV